MNTPQITTTNSLLELAHWTVGGNPKVAAFSSASLCLSDARKAYLRSDVATVKRASLRAIAYSVGISSPVYARAWKLAGKSTPITLA